MRGTRLASCPGMPADPQVSFASAAIASKEIAERTLHPSSGANVAGGDGQPADSRKKSARKPKVWVYLIAGLVIAGGVFFWRHSAGGQGAGNAAPESTLPLETFVVNLDGSGQRAYLRVGITLGLSRPLARNKEDVPIAALRDAILSVLASARADQLLTADGKEQLKSDLVRVIGERVPEMGVENVYFTEFLVQM